ncbi:ubiquitin-conjugating enzyme E2 R2-like [Nasonia vitripennis]|uniref:UBC core domain-containing protein n=1 Tax=Nasonia vitripennis TaxID=7425 RepID=A0A7M7R076_NASVI|nr:ubiquitin-conjugating enzyme E2 R2-like [Nasonia vitripennis]
MEEMAELAVATSSAVRALTLEYKKLQEEPVEGFRVKLVDDSNMFEWEVSIFGPPDTIYQGGYFKARMLFPIDYPYSPPSLHFTSKFLHPNVFVDGRLCISILHPPINDPSSGESASERWTPARSVRTVLLSVISLMNEPNVSSPANVDASVMYRRWKQGGDDQYAKIVKSQVQASKAEAEKEGVVVPLTIEDYCNEVKDKIKKKDEVDDCIDFYDFNNYDNDYDDDDDEDDYKCSEEGNEDGEDDE